MARPAPTTTSASSARWVSADPGPDGTSGGGGGGFEPIVPGRHHPEGEVLLESVPGRWVPMSLPHSVTPSAPPRAHLLVSLVLLEPLLAERLREQRDTEPAAPLR